METFGRVPERVLLPYLSSLGSPLLKYRAETLNSKVR